jgi:hypothetical protein
MSETNSACTACGASFGVKFAQYTCVVCGGEFCAGDLFPSHHTRMHSDLRAPYAGERRGTCIECVLSVWGKSEEKLIRPRGLGGRMRRQATNGWEWVRAKLPGQRRREDLLAVDEQAFSDLNWEKSLSVARHQKDMSQEEIASSLVLFARVYAVSQGRESERSISLQDIYALVAWVRTHPRIPQFVHGIQWSTIESTPAYLNYISDAWHIANAAIALSNPVIGAAKVLYHVADRAVDQVADKGLFGGFYDLVKDRLGLNVNPKSALLSYLAGLMILQLLKNREEKGQRRPFAIHFKVGKYGVGVTAADEVRPQPHMGQEAV